MSALAKNTAATPIPVQLSAIACNTFLFLHLSMAKRAPRCNLGSHLVFHSWVLSTGIQ